MSSLIDQIGVDDLIRKTAFDEDRFSLKEGDPLAIDTRFDDL